MQLIFPSALVTVPEPDPVSLTVRVYDVDDAVNVAVTVVSAFKVSVHWLPVPLHPDHPPNIAPEAGISFSVTFVPIGYDTEQAALPCVPH
jgi:hypothetical protein